MSAPNTNIDKQARRHRGPLIGMAIAVLFAVGVILYWLGEETARAPGSNEVAPEAPAPGAVTEPAPVEPVTPPPENSGPAPTDQAPTSPTPAPTTPPAPAPAAPAVPAPQAPAAPAP